MNFPGHHNFLLLAFITLSISCFGQDGEGSGEFICGSHSYYQQKVNQSTFYEKLVETYSKNLAAYTSQYCANSTIVIPVCMHVILPDARNKLSYEKLKALIDTLNVDFSRKKSSSTKIPAVFKNLAAECNIRFTLQEWNIDYLNSNKIFEVNLDETEKFNQGWHQMKFGSAGGVNVDSPNEFLNIWIVNMKEVNHPSKNLLGYSTFPGDNKDFDGVVVHYKSLPGNDAWAEFNQGRTLTHEVGHWLGLLHLWGDRDDCSGDDRCSDTPKQKGPNKGKPAFGKKSCTSDYDMFMNYMDYTDDDVRAMFTLEQKRIMRSHFCPGGSRSDFGNKYNAFSTLANKVLPGRFPLFNEYSLDNVEPAESFPVSQILVVPAVSDIKADSAGYLLVKWQHVQGNTGYWVKLVDPESNNAITFQTMKTSLTAGNLLPGKPYYITITAYAPGTTSLESPPYVFTLTRALQNPNVDIKF